MTRIRIAVIGVLAIAVLTIFNLLLDTPNLSFSNVEVFDRHVAQLRAALPASATVGYYTDAPSTNTTLQEYYLVQYALAPAVVSKSLDQPFVVANYHDQKHATPGGFEVVRDFGSGIILLRKVPK